jgi:folylpolyglutamate synthase/dihydropteroate synthase
VLWLQDCAAAVGSELQVAPSLAQFSAPDPTQQISVGLAGDHQLLNASLAVALVSSWEQAYLNQQQQHLSNGSSSAVDAAAAAEASGDAAVKVAAATERLQQLQSGVLPPAYCDGLPKATWPGRSQVSVLCAGLSALSNTPCSCRGVAGLFTDAVFLATLFRGGQHVHAG